MTPRRLFATCALLVALPFTHAHATPAQVQALQQVNRDIWEPFVRGVGDFSFSRDRRALFATRPDNIFVLKVNYWINP